MSVRTVSAVALLVVLCAGVADARPRHHFGVGMHYWKTVKDIDVENVDESGFATVFSYQYRPAMLLKFGAELEVLPKKFGGADTQVYAPQGYVFVGSLIYAGLGIGTYYADGDFSSDPFFNLRAGLEIPVFIRTSLDINANYRFNNWDDIKNVEDRINTETVTLGAAIRIKI